ncbi:MAG: DNA polymerase I [Lachnospiraceae bacterium]|nr:DNA polymerase I [Lachnospiraceae bacterium]
MKKVMMLDGHSLIHRAFYGMPDFTNAEGIHTGAVYGFLSILFMLLEQQKPDALIVAFDVHAPTFRHDMYTEYKGNRKPMPPELREQIPLMKEVLGAMDVTIVEKEGIEADDVLGSLAVQMAAEGNEVVIVSGDRDLLQLADEHVTICIPKTKKGTTVYEIYHPQEVKDLYKVTPKEFIDVKALMGDASDNIPGIPGVGEKTASNLIEQFGSIEEAYAHIDEVKPPRAQKALREHYDLAKLSKVLATIKTDADLGEAEKLVDEALLPADQDASSGDPAAVLYTDETEKMFRRLNFRKYLQRFEGLKKAGLNAGEEPAEDAGKRLNVVSTDDISEAEKLLAGADLPVGMALVRKSADNPLMEMLGRSVTAVACVCGQTAVLAELDSSGKAAEEIAGMVTRFTENGRTVSVIHLKEFMKEVELSDSPLLYDPAIAAYLLNPLQSSYDTEDLAALRPDDVLAAQSEEEKDKAVFEAETASLLVPVLEERLKETGMNGLMHDIEMPLVFTLDRMEKTGVVVERDELKVYADKLRASIEELQAGIYEAAGETFNINSPKQLGDILFDKMGMPHGKKTKTGYSTSAKVLDTLAEDYPFVRDILEYRQLTKLLSTYAEGLARFIEPDGRIHGTFNQTVTATGRISSTEPNLQNIPIRFELGRMIRKAFVPKKGCIFIDADYSQVELRILAHLSGDQKLIEAYRQAQDIHRTTASQVFNVPFDEVTEAQRRDAKAVNFGIVYGISSFGLSQGLSISRQQAKEYIDHYFETFPGIKKFLDDTVEFAKKSGYVTTMFGRRRPIPELTSGNYMQRQFGERVAMNSPIQGTAADIMKIAMIRVEKALNEAGLEAKVVLQVHDELLVEAPERESEEVCRIVKQEMENAASLSVMLGVDVGTGSDWYEAH